MKLIADDYINRGWIPVPVHPRSKAVKDPGARWPQGMKWTDPAYRPTAAEFEPKDNIGIRLDNVMVTDADDAHTSALAKLMLPPTLMHGRGADLQSHLYYNVIKDATRLSWEAPDKDPVTGHATIFELLFGSGEHVLAPPSTHPSGEGIAFFDPTTPVGTPDNWPYFHARCLDIAVGGYVFRYWDTFGHDSMGMLAGGLLHAGWDEQRVVQLYRVMGQVGPAVEHAKDMIAFAKGTCAKFKDGGQVFGFTELTAKLGERLVQPLMAMVRSKKSRDVARTITLTSADTITPKQLEWAWTDWMPMGSLGLMAGREDLGKSQALIWLAAQLTTGQLPGAFFMCPRRVLIAADEDSWEHTLVPRLMAAGADLTRVHRIEVSTSVGDVELTLPVDIPALKKEIERLGDVALMILDPVISKLDGKLDSHKDAEVRRALIPLRTLAEETQIIISGIIHVNKSNSTDPLNSIMGSRAFTAVPRFVHFVLQDPTDDSTRLFGLIKNNLGPKPLITRTFKIEGVTASNIKTSRIVWGKDQPRTIRQILQEQQTMQKNTRTGSAARWLKAYLEARNGIADSKLVKTDAAAAGFSEKELRSARDQMQLIVAFAGKNQTTWSLPTPSATFAP